MQSQGTQSTQVADKQPQTTAQVELVAQWAMMSMEEKSEEAAEEDPCDYMKGFGWAA